MKPKEMDDEEEMEGVNKDENSNEEKEEYKVAEEPTIKPSDHRMRR